MNKINVIGTTGSVIRNLSVRRLLLNIHILARKVVGVYVGINLIISQLCYAGEGRGYVTEMKASTTSDVVMFSLSSGIENTPRCNEEKMLSINLNQAGGQAVFSLPKFAVENNLEIKAYGLNTCKGYWKSEDVKDILVKFEQ